MSELTIRQLRESDADNLAMHGNNKKIWDNMRDYFPSPYQLNDAYSFIKLNLSKEPDTAFAICEDDQLIGIIGYNMQSDVYRHSAEIGYWVGEEFWGKGLVTQALELAVDHAFNVGDVKRLFTTVFEKNISSIKVLEKNGFFLEGKGIKSVIKNNEYLSELRYALLNPKHFSEIPAQ